MKYEEVKELTTQELKDRIAEEKSNLTRLKFSHAVSALENPLRIRQ
ncbi:MAG TPA: 50S ribosomal protein L29, partial [Anseongella sp.]|nr:50S ribosomal protein L29 [Anseongella sp.]